MKKNSKNNYYVMDARLENQNEDEFRHKEISDCMLNLITNNDYPTPYNIALIGKWGLGKSSILNILEECLKKEDKNYKVILINAWKYESESLKKVFLKEIYEKVSNTKISYLKELVTKLNKIFVKEDSENNKKNMFISILPYVAFSLLLSFVWQITGYVANKGKLSNLPDYKISYLICKYFYFYFENIFFTLSITILPTIITKWLNKESNIFPIQIDYQTDYEVLLKNLTKEQTKTDKFIIIIDDLDRLSTKKMVEALDVLKTLMEIDKCVFIVPFDDSILKDALNKQIVSKFDNDQQVIESEFILDKLFQFRFYVPPLISSDMKDYTLNIIKTKAKDLYEMLTEDEIEEIVKMIFMYDGLKTPRQIKKIINTFANNMLLFTSRVQGGKIDSSLLNKDGKLMIAKLSVLQSDFNDFYDDLFNDSNLCEEVLKVNKNECNEYKEYKDIPKPTQKYFISKNNKIIIKEQYDKLINFLSRTSYIKSPDISVYLCCNQDRMSFLNGSEFNRKLLNSMQSMNFTSMNSIIQENKQADIKSIFIEYLELDDSYNLPMLIVSIMNVKDFEFDDDKFNEKYTSFISKVYNSMENFDWKHLKNINLEQLLKLKCKTNNEIVNRVLNDYFGLLYNNVDSNEVKHNNIFEILIAHLNELNNLNQSTIKNYLYSLCQKDLSYIKQLNDFSISNDLLKTYFGESLYKLIVNELNEDDGDNVDSFKYKIYSELLTKMYDSLKNDACIVSINMDIINLLDDPKNICLCKNIITSNAHLFNLEEKNNILNKVVMLSEDELEQQYDIINALSIDITTENEEFQDKMITFIDNDYDIENIMNNINNYSLIDNVVKELNSKIYSNSKIDSIYKNNIEKFDSDQLDKLVDILESTINIDTYKEGRLFSITNIIHNKVYIDKLVKCFTNDELIKNEISANEIISIIKSDDDIEESIIDDYIKRIIELLPTNNKNMGLLAKMIDYISYDNLKLLITTTTNEVINNLEKEELKSLFSIYKETRIDENNVEEITLGLNTLLYTDIYNQVLGYMISKKIMIDKPIEFIFENIDDLDELKNYSNLKEILKIDEEFIDFLIEKLKTTEYTTEQLKYLITLDESILSTVKERLLKFNADNKIALLNIQKIIVSIGNENDLTQFQLDILKSNDNELIISILMDLSPIKNTINRKQIKIAIETLLNSEDTNELLAEKIENFANNNHYRKFKVKKEKQTTS